MYMEIYVLIFTRGHPYVSSLHSLSQFMFLWFKKIESLYVVEVF